MERIRELGVTPGVSVNPATPVEMLHEIIPFADLVPVMSVNPGFGGQRYIPATTDKIRRARHHLDERGRVGAELQVDGGIDVLTGPRAVEAGASCLVAGSAVFGHPDGVAAGVKALRDAIDAQPPAPVHRS